MPEDVEQNLFILSARRQIDRPFFPASERRTERQYVIVTAPAKDYDTSSDVLDAGDEVFRGPWTRKPEEDTLSAGREKAAALLDSLE